MAAAAASKGWFRKTTPAGNSVMRNQTKLMLGVGGVGAAFVLIPKLFSNDANNILGTFLPFIPEEWRTSVCSMICCLLCCCTSCSGVIGIYMKMTGGGD
jgi:hypothetical protein